MKDALLSAGSHLGGEPLLRWWHRKRLLILMYHGVVEEALEPFCWHQLPLPAFRQQLEWVAARYHVLPLEEALARRKEGTLPPRSCAITFDDGYRNVATVAAPVLRALGLPATVFLVTDLVGGDAVPWPDRVWLALADARRSEIDLEDLGLGRCPLDTTAAKADTIERVLAVLKSVPVAAKDRWLEDLAIRSGAEEPPGAGPFEMLTWEDVSALEAENLIGFGPHSLTHEILSRCDDAEVERQIVASQAALERRLGRAPRVFAYPNGGVADFDERARRAVRGAGMPWALATRLGLVGRDSDALALPRISVGADLSLPRFRWLCAGLT